MELCDLAETSDEDIKLQKDGRSKGGESEMDRIRCLFKKWVPAEEYDRTVNPEAAHHAAPAQQFFKSHDQIPLLIGPARFH